MEFHDELNRRNFICGASVAMAALAAPSIAGAKTQPTLLLRVVPPHPRASRDQDGNWQGFDLECCHAIGEVAGFKVKPITLSNWKRALAQMEHSGLDLLTTVSYVPERAQYLDYVGTFDTEQTIMMVLKENAHKKFETLDDFMEPGLVIQTTAAAFIEKGFNARLNSDPEFASHFVKATGSTRTDRWGHLINSIRRVETGRVFGAFLDWYGYEMIMRSPERFEKLGFVPVPLARIEIPAFGKPSTFLAISRNQPLEIRQATIAAYADIRANGTFEALWRKWHGDRDLPADVRPGSQ